MYLMCNTKVCNIKLTQSGCFHRKLRFLSPPSLLTLNVELRPGRSVTERIGNTRKHTRCKKDLLCRRSLLWEDKNQGQRKDINRKKSPFGVTFLVNIVMWWKSPWPPCFTGRLRKNLLLSLENGGSCLCGEKLVPQRWHALCRNEFCRILPQ